MHTLEWLGLVSGIGAALLVAVTFLILIAKRSARLHRSLVRVVLYYGNEAASSFHWARSRLCPRVGPVRMHPDLQRSLHARSPAVPFTGHRLCANLRRLGLASAHRRRRVPG
jgi:hypothetical protein